MPGFLSRRSVLGLFSAVFLLLPFSAHALSNSEAEQLVEAIVSDVNTVIASGKSEAAMYQDFEAIFAKYADVPAIARYSLGVEARSATPQQLSAYAQAFRGYVARKYGQRFREFVGGQIEVQGSEAISRGYAVETTALLRGQNPFRVDFLVSDVSGKPLFFNLIVEGVDMLLSERAEIGALLDQRRGNLDQLIADLPNL